MSCANRQLLQSVSPLQEQHCKECLKHSMRTDKVVLYLLVKIVLHGGVFQLNQVIFTIKWHFGVTTMILTNQLIK